MDIKTRAYSPGDEKQILSLYKKVFSESPSMDEWNWRFRKHFLNNQFIQVAEHENRMIGQYALMPIPLLINAKAKNGALSLHTMVDPDYRGKGLFTLLANELFESGNCTSNATLAIGFPNQNSYPGFVRKLGWQHIGDLDLLILPVDFLETLKRYKPNLINKPFVKPALKYLEKMHTLIWRSEFRNSRLQINKVVRFDSKFDDLFAQSMEQFKANRLNKTSEYMNWRYIDCPNVDYQCYELSESGNLTSMVALSVNNNRGVIVDVVSGSSADYLDAIKFAVDALRKQNVNYILAWQNSYYHALPRINKFGFIKALKVPMIIKNFTENNAAVVDISNWHIMPGDNDTY